VGLYQHDVNQKQLAEQLDEVVGSVVNQVGVNLNTASYSLLRYVSGINTSLARKIVKFRDASGVIRNRSLLREIPGLGEKTFEQCAGFLKIPESGNSLDNSWVHPENYALAAEIQPIVKSGRDPSREERAALKENYGVGDITLDDIIAELKKPNRDPREDLPPPLLQQGVLSFEDLQPGMKVKGKVKNVVDFGAFVDIGIKESALIHVSEMGDRFVKNPMEVLRVGDSRNLRSSASILCGGASNCRSDAGEGADRAGRGVGEAQKGAKATRCAGFGRPERAKGRLSENPQGAANGYGSATEFERAAAPRGRPSREDSDDGMTTTPSRIC